MRRSPPRTSGPTPTTASVIPPARFTRGSAGATRRSAGCRCTGPGWPASRTWAGPTSSRSPAGTRRGCRPYAGAAGPPWVPAGTSAAGRGPTPGPDRRPSARGDAVQDRCRELVGGLLGDPVGDPGELHERVVAGDVRGAALGGDPADRDV